MRISKSEKKRQARRLAGIAAELADLPVTALEELPGGDDLRRAIVLVHGLQGGARQRQIRYIGKLLREELPDGLLEFLDRRRGSDLRARQVFHELERVRERIIDEAAAGQVDESIPVPRGELLSSELQAELAGAFPGLDLGAVESAARNFVRTGRTVYRREIFRMLRAARERAAIRAAVADSPP